MFLEHLEQISILESMVWKIHHTKLLRSIVFFFFCINEYKNNTNLNYTKDMTHANASDLSNWNLRHKTLIIQTTNTGDLRFPPPFLLSSKRCGAVERQAGEGRGECGGRKEWGALEVLLMREKQSTSYLALVVRRRVRSELLLQPWRGPPHSAWKVTITTRLSRALLRSN